MRAEPLLPDWCEEWLVVERERVRCRQVETFELLAGARLRQRRFADWPDRAIVAVNLARVAAVEGGSSAVFSGVMAGLCS